MKKNLAIILCLTMLVTLFAVPAMAEEADWETQDITIRFLNRQVPGVDALGTPMKTACDEFMEMHPNVTVEYEAIAGGDDSQFYEKMRTAAATGNMYELFMNYGGSTVLSYVQSGVLHDLTPDFEEDPEWAARFNNLFGMWQYKDIEGTYGVPLTKFATFLYCNDKIFADNGLEIPKTMTEFTDVCDAFLEKGITPIPRSGEGWRWAHWATGFAMQLYGPQLTYDIRDRVKKYTDDEMVGIAQMFLDWQEKGYFGDHIASLDSATEQALFSSGQSPMIAIGTWQPDHTIMNNPENLDDISVVWFPYFEEKPEYAHYNMGGPNDGLCIAEKDPATTKATVELLKYLTSEKVSTDILQSGYTQPLSTPGEAPESLNRLAVDAMEMLALDDVSLMQEIDQYDTIPTMQSVLRNAYEGMMAGGMTAMEAMEEVQMEIDDYVE